MKLGCVLGVIGVIAILTVVFKAVIGFYLKDLIWMLPVGIVGFILGSIAAKMLKTNDK